MEQGPAVPGRQGPLCRAGLTTESSKGASGTAPAPGHLVLGPGRQTLVAGRNLFVNKYDCVNSIPTW